MKRSKENTPKWNPKATREERLAAIRARFPMTIADVDANGAIIKRSI